MPRTEPFDEYSDAYDEWFEENLDLYEAELEAIRRLLPPPGAEGMEVGVDSGKFAAPLGIRIGVEPSKVMAIKAREQGIDVYPGVAKDLSFPDGRFDFVLHERCEMNSAGKVPDRDLELRHDGEADVFDCAVTADLRPVGQVSVSGSVRCRRSAVQFRTRHVSLESYTSGSPC